MRSILRGVNNKIKIVFIKRNRYIKKGHPSFLELNPSGFGVQKSYGAQFNNPDLVQFVSRFRCKLRLKIVGKSDQNSYF